MRTVAEAWVRERGEGRCEERGCSRLGLDVGAGRFVEDDRVDSSLNDRRDMKDLNQSQPTESVQSTQRKTDGRKLKLTILPLLLLPDRPLPLRSLLHAPQPRKDLLPRMRALQMTQIVHRRVLTS